MASLNNEFHKKIEHPFWTFALTENVHTDPILLYFYGVLTL